MKSDNIPDDVMKQVILERTSLKSLSGTFEKFKYLNNVLFEKINSKNNFFLFVGVGHGLDSIMALKQGHANYIEGIDPYFSEDGNGEEDYKTLKNLIKKIGLNNKFKLLKTTFDKYYLRNKKKFDEIVINDVLHHIFVTCENLNQSKLHDKAVNMFIKLRRLLKEDGFLVISDVNRIGFRQFLVNKKIIKSCVDYSTKQNWNQWYGALKKAGWYLEHLENYVPFHLRAFRKILKGKLGRYTICEKYIMYLRLKK